MLALGIAVMLGLQKGAAGDLTRLADILWEVPYPERKREAMPIFRKLSRIGNKNLLQACSQFVEEARPEWHDTDDPAKLKAMWIKASDNGLRLWKRAFAVYALNRYVFQVPSGAATRGTPFDRVAGDQGNRIWPWTVTPSGKLGLLDYIPSMPMPFWPDPEGELVWLCSHGHRRPARQR